MGEQAKDIIRKLLTVDPTERITVAEALEHPRIKVRACASNVANMTVSERPIAKFARINTQKFQQPCEKIATSPFDKLPFHCLFQVVGAALEQVRDGCTGGGGGALDREVQRMGHVN